MRTKMIRHHDNMSRPIAQKVVVAGGFLVRTKDARASDSVCGCGCKGAAHRHGAASMDATRKAVAARLARRDAATATRITAINQANAEHWRPSK